MGSLVIKERFRESGVGCCRDGGSDLPLCHQPVPAAARGGPGTGLGVAEA